MNTLHNGNKTSTVEMNKATNITSLIKMCKKRNIVNSQTGPVT